MTENPMQLRVAQRLEPVREKKVDMDADVRVDVDASLTGLGVAGLAATALGALATVVGGILFAVRYDPAGTPVAALESTVLTLAAGITLLFLGASMFFHGRTVLGAGSLEHIHFETTPEEPDGSFTVANPGPGIASFRGATEAPAEGGYAYHDEDPWTEVQA